MKEKEPQVIVQQKKKEQPLNEHEGNRAVKQAMAEELESLGLHRRSIERLLNIELDTRRAGDFTQTSIRKESHG